MSKPDKLTCATMFFGIAFGWLIGGRWGAIIATLFIFAGIAFLISYWRHPELPPTAKAIDHILDSHGQILPARSKFNRTKVLWILFVIAALGTTVSVGVRHRRPGPPVQPAPSATQIADEVAKRLPKSTNSASITEDISRRTAAKVSTRVTKGPTNDTRKAELTANETFSVSVEWAMFSYGGEGYGTGFWAYYQSPNGCTVSPIQAVFFIRIKNLQSTPVTVIGYSLDVFGVPLTRTSMGNIVRIPDKGSVNGPRRPSGFPIERSINFGQGPGFSIVHFQVDNADFSQGFLLQMDLIENLLKSPLQPNMPIRGWAFYQSPNENAFSVAGPGHITLETDDSRTFAYSFDLRNPRPELDILDRLMTAKSFIDLSGCNRR